MFIYVNFCSWQQFMNSDFKYLYFFQIDLNYFKSCPRLQACLPLFSRGKVLAVVITVKVYLLVPEFTVTHLLPYLLTVPLCGQWRVQWSEPEYWLCFSVGYYGTWLWIRLSTLSFEAIPQNLCRSLIFSLPMVGKIMWRLFIESLYSFYWEMRLNKCRPSGRLA